MPYCSNCGAQHEAGAKYCPTCGVAIPTPNVPPKSPNQAQSNASDAINRAADKVGAAFEKFTDAPDHSGECAADDIAQNKIFAIFAYIGIFVVIPIFAAPRSKFARFHANNGLNLFILEAIVWFVCFLIKLPLHAAAFWGVSAGWVVVTVIEWLLMIPLIVFSVLGIVYAATGKAKDLPLISAVKLLK